MTKQDLQRKLRANYNRDTWKEVLLEMFPEADLFAQDLSTPLDRKEQQNLANHIVQYGEVALGDDTLIFLEVELQPESVQLTKNRVGLRRLVDNEVVPGLTDAALITYYQPETDEWRISFYSERYGWDEDGKSIKEETHPKRYTYVVGPAESCKTVAEQLINVVDKGLENTLEHVLKAFSVQKVSKEFFKEYKEQYDKFVGHLTGKNWTKSGVKDVGERISQFPFYFKATTDHEKEARDFVKKLLGRIVFLYFVQKKKWLGASSTDFNDGNPDFIYDLFKQVPEEDGKKEQFYSQWLTKLFFDTLNKDDDHAFEMPNGNTVYIPFLNGGLFEKDETDKNTETLPLPGELFSNPEDTESPNTRGFLDFLSAFNFTIHEDSPGDHTIAVDPEMLGHIFENLLEDNKDKGAYYTPKPIVHYMCQESLIEYLLTELTTHSASSGQAPDTEDNEKNELRNHLEDLIKKQEAGELVGQTEDILKALKKVKVCDPAIGSGAFPMGILQEIYQAVETLHHLSPDNVQAIWELPDEKWHPAEVKKQIIQNSIYGVDIEKGAVDIARLRFWLSLIVDEEEPTALPNLDYKIVVGNSLVSMFEEDVINIDWSLNDMEHGLFGQELSQQRINLLKEIDNKQRAYFNPKAKKRVIAEEIRNLKIDLLITQLKLMIKTKGIEKKPTGSGAKYEKQLGQYLKTNDWKQYIQKLEKLKKDAEEPFLYFDWKLDFPEVMNGNIPSEEGFDIVIGNPPYVQLQKEGGKLAKLYENQDFKTFERTGDIYSLFYEKGFELLKKEGVHTFITSNKWMRAGYGKSLRKYFSEQVDPIKLIDLGANVFETATVDTNILIAKNQMPKDNIVQAISLNGSGKENRFSALNGPFTNLKNLSENSWVVLSPDAQKIKEKVQKQGELIEDWNLEINRGILTGYNKAFIIDEETRDKLIKEDSKNKEVLKPILRGRDIKKYKPQFANHWVIATFPSRELDIEDYPSVKKYLLSFDKRRLEQASKTYVDSTGKKRKSRKKTSNKWFETQDTIAYWKEFEKPKIIYPNMTKYLPFVYDKGSFYTNQKCFILTGDQLGYLTAFFNSLLFKYVYRDDFPELQGGTRELSKIFFEKISVKKLNDHQIIEKLENMVSRISDIKKGSSEFDSLDRELNELIFDIYELTETEKESVRKFKF
jgi:hypothetical protein